MPDRSLFYVPKLSRSDIDVTISGSEYNHIRNVKRYGQNDVLELVNGDGYIFEGVISGISDGKIHCHVRSVRESRNELRGATELAVCLIRQQRFEWMAEKLTELGVQKITPIHSDHVVRLGFRLDRIEKKIIAAMKQSERAYLPRISEPVTVNDYLDSTGAPHVLVADQRSAEASLGEVLRERAFSNISILIGPEGGWSAAEEKAFNSRGILRVRLGTRRLRTETAAVCAQTLIAERMEPEYEENGGRQ